jgi:hypothetical protein
MMAPPAIVVSSAATIDSDRLLACIAEVERVRGSRRRGPVGERGKYQFTRETWESVTAIPFEQAEDDAVSDQVARFYLNKLRYQMLERRIDPTPYLLALAWNCGLTGAILRSFQPIEAKNYAEGVCALYRDTTWKR